MQEQEADQYDDRVTNVELCEFRTESTSYGKKYRIERIIITGRTNGKNCLEINK